MSSKLRKTSRYLCLLLVLAGCTRVNDCIEPKINYAIQDKYIKKLPSPFPPLSEREKEEDWGREFHIGLAFAHQLDLYQAMTAFKRAAILTPPDAQERKLQIDYEILLCYYIGKKYFELTQFYEGSSLRYVNSNFKAFEDLLIILYDSYYQIRDENKSCQMLNLLRQNYPEIEEKLQLSSDFSEGKLSALQEKTEGRPYVEQFLCEYQAERKSVTAGKVLNAILPGAGYLYVGQKQSAVTAFLLNGLFIAAAVHFYKTDNLAAGIIFTSFEAGWYFGGIHGAAEEVKFYNERLFERKASPVMNERGLFPVLMLTYAF